MAARIIALLFTFSTVTVFAGLVIWVRDASTLAFYLLLAISVVWALTNIWEFLVDE